MPSLSMLNSILNLRNMLRRRSVKGNLEACWWPQHSVDICRLLWEDLGNWHSSLRKKAHVYMSQHYKWDPDNCREENIGIAKGLLGDVGNVEQRCMAQRPAPLDSP
ncbi:hypothetical protein EDD15DRAFT_2369688 [Pisolithus albus]|nr:hypothetical protein EDD15DRAFT_2369688 [Pisolithus albus]